MNFLLLLTIASFSKFAARNVVAATSSIKTGDFLYYDSLDGEAYTVTYDDRSFIINGERTLLLGGSVHYPRLSPGQWNDILMKARNDGLNHVEVYVFWNLHEPYYDLSGNHSYTLNGRANLTGFLEVAKNNGLFVNLRIGPYVCAEWSFGGLPLWLLHVPNISFRDNNEPWEDEMETFVTWVTDLVTPYLAKNGGPIILAQIENEYHGSQEYVNWCGNLADSLDLGVAWVMCNGMSANNTVNTCNGNDCYSSYVPSHSLKYPGQPLAWTENEGWFQYWTPSSGNEYVANETGWANRSPEDMAYVVATWFASGAAHHNYYMWYGGNHISWTAGSSITSYYADGVNYHADGLANEPKRSHLSKLHSLLAQSNAILLSDTIQYGNEIYIAPDNTQDLDFTDYTHFSLQFDECDGKVSNLQHFSYKNNQLTWTPPTGSITYCAVATGTSNPVELVICNSSDSKQEWTYNTDNSLQIKNNAKNTCLDVYSEHGPNIDEYSCKDPTSSDAANQQWTFSNTNNNTGMLISKLDTSYCLTVSNKTNTFAYVYHKNKTNQDSDEMVTFLVNIDSSNDFTVTWEGIEYDLPSQSVSILDGQGEELMNTAKVDTSNVPSERVYKVLYSGENDLEFTSWKEEIPLDSNGQNRSDTPTYNKTPMEQLRFSNGSSEYLYYVTQLNTDFSKLNNDGLMLRFVGQEASAYNVWFNNEFIGSGWNGAHSSGDVNYSVSMNMTTTNCNDSNTECILTILSSSLGVHNGINNQQGEDAQDKKGITGNVQLLSYDVGITKIIDDYTNMGWEHWIGSTGEVLNVTGSGGSSVSWSSPAVTDSPMTWYKTSFITPDISMFVSDISGEISGVLLIDIGKNGMGMKRGHWWLNGIDMGHYNNAFETSNNNNFMVQRYYYIPLDYLTYDGSMNELIFEEELPIDNQNSLSNVNVVYSTFVIPQ